MNEKKFSVQELEEKIEIVLKRWNVPGAAVGIIKDDELISGRGYGVRDLNDSLPVDAETNFAIGSNSKAFTAACIGMLVEEGKLAWDDKVVQYLPDFAVYDPWVTKEVTIRDILSHRVGVCDVERFLYNSTCSNAEVVRRLRYVQPAAPFRADFQYSNISFMAAGEILRVVTGENWEAMVHERIFKPLGMDRSTTNFMDVQSMENIAMPHVNQYSRLLSMRARILDPLYSIPWYDFGSQAAGGITSNVVDMAKWLGCFLRNGSYHGKVVLQTDTAAMMTRPTNIIQNPIVSMASLAMVKPDVNFWTYGLGWFVLDYKGRKFVFHGGQVQGMISICGFLPQENLGLVILTNVNLSLVQVVVCLTILDAFVGGISRDWCGECLELAGMLRQREEQQAKQLISARKTDRQPSLPLNAFKGTFDHEYFGEHTVTIEDGELVLRFAPHNIGHLEHWQEDTFLIHWRDDPFEGDFLTFSIGAGGRVDGFTIKSEGFFKKK